MPDAPQPKPKQKCAVFFMLNRPLRWGEKGYFGVGVGDSVAWVRAVLVETDDLCEALDMACPRPDENFMNSHYAPEGA